MNFKGLYIKLYNNYTKLYILQYKKPPHKSAAALFTYSSFYRRIVIVNPFPFLFSAVILPLCACTIAFATDRPIPDPPVPEFLFYL